MSGDGDGERSLVRCILAKALKAGCVRLRRQGKLYWRYRGILQGIKLRPGRVLRTTAIDENRLHLHIS